MSPSIPRCIFGFEYALNHLEQDPTKVENASRKSNSIGSAGKHAYSSSYVAFHGIKTYLTVKNFVAYNGGDSINAGRAISGRR